MKGTSYVFFGFLFFLLQGGAMSGSGAQEREYGEQLTTVLQMVWGEGMLSPGGTQKFDTIFQHAGVAGKRILDFGCGLGGYAIHLAKDYEANVVAVDIDPELIKQAQARAEAAGVAQKIQFLVSDGKSLAIEDGLFDIIFSKEAILHVADKAALFKRFYRLLKPGGQLIISDWCHKQAQYSQDMARFVTIDGLTFFLCTFDEYKRALSEAGFASPSLLDTSAETLRETERDCKTIAETPVGQDLVQKFGKTCRDEYLESWLLQAKVFAAGELKSCLIEAQT